MQSFRLDFNNWHKILDVFLDSDADTIALASWFRGGWYNPRTSEALPIHRSARFGIYINDILTYKNGDIIYVSRGRISSVPPNYLLIGKLRRA